MATTDGRASCHPSRRKPSPSGRRLAPQDEDRERGNGRFHGIAHRRCARWKLVNPLSSKLATAACPTDLPDGLFLRWAVQSHLQKYFAFPPTQITSYPPSSRPTGGAYRDRHGRGMRCGGRGSVGRAMGSQGGLISVSEHLGTRRRRRCIFFPPSLKLRRDMPRWSLGFGSGHAASKPWRRRGRVRGR